MFPSKNANTKLFRILCNFFIDRQRAAEFVNFRRLQHARVADDFLFHAADKILKTRTEADQKQQTLALAILAVVKGDLTVDWTVNAVVKEIKNGDQKEVFSKARALTTRIKDMFADGPTVLVSEGCSIRLEDQDITGSAGANIHHFKIESLDIAE